jgi:hypothetical protein
MVASQEIAETPLCPTQQLLLSVTVAELVLPRDLRTTWPK